MLYNAFVTLTKFILACVGVGVALSAIDVTPGEVLREMGLSPDQIYFYFEQLVAWALPHLILGAIVVVPIWLLIYLFRPPGFGKGK